MSPVKISYIIITWNGLAYLQRLLASMTRQLQRPDVEVLLCDNGSTDGTAEFIRTSYPALRYIPLPQNKGVAYARNRALEQAKGQYRFIVDNDLELTDEAVVTLEQYMDTHPQTGLVAPSLVFPDRTLQGSAKYYPGLVRKLRNVLFPHRRTMDYAAQLQAATPFEPEYVIGACQLVRAEALQAVGLLDEHIFYGPEDADFCIRLHKNGWQVICLPTVHVMHHCQRMTTHRPLSPIGRAHIKALLYFYRKHRRL